MLKLNPNLSIITVKVNGLNISIKRQRLSDAFFFPQKRPNYMLKPTVSMM